MRNYSKLHTRQKVRSLRNNHRVIGNVEPSTQFESDAIAQTPMLIPIRCGAETRVGSGP